MTTSSVFGPNSTIAYVVLYVIFCVMGNYLGPHIFSRTQERLNKSLVLLSKNQNAFNFWIIFVAVTDTVEVAEEALPPRTAILTFVLYSLRYKNRNSNKMLFFLIDLNYVNSKTKKNIKFMKIGFFILWFQFFTKRLSIHTGKKTPHLEFILSASIGFVPHLCRYIRDENWRHCDGMGI